MPNKKSVSKKPAKKVVAPKAGKPKKEKGVTISEAKLEFVSFSVRAVIPTQQYGNIQPEIVVKAPTYEQARDFAMAHMEDLYKYYAESKPGFLGKVVETEKVVAPAATVAPAAPQAQDTPAPVAQDVPAPEATNVAPGPKSEAVAKAEKAIGLAATSEALIAIQEQIERSTKIDAADKPALITLVLEKRGKFQ